MSYKEGSHAIVMGLKQIAEERFVSGMSQKIVGLDLTLHDQWSAFQKFWETLEIDRYMNDGGTYRYRRFGRFKWYGHQNKLELEPHGPYCQPKYLNSLNGGMERHFAPVTNDMENNFILLYLLRTLATICSEIEDVPTWKINTYFNRILANNHVAGKPVPEGMHRDGVKFSCLFMVKRHGIEGGTTTLFDIATKQSVYTGTLTKPGEMLVFRDDTVFHDTTAITVLNNDRPGFRDVLVIELH